MRKRKAKKAEAKAKKTKANAEALSHTPNRSADFVIILALWFRFCLYLRFRVPIAEDPSGAPGLVLRSDSESAGKIMQIRSLSEKFDFY